MVYFIKFDKHIFDYINLLPDVFNLYIDVVSYLEKIVRGLIFPRSFSISLLNMKLSSQ